MPHQRLRLLPRPDLHRVSALLALSLCFECVCAAHARPELTLTHTAPNPTTNQPTPPPPRRKKTSLSSHTPIFALQPRQNRHPGHLRVERVHAPSFLDGTAS